MMMQAILKEDSSIGRFVLRNYSGGEAIALGALSCAWKCALTTLPPEARDGKERVGNPNETR